MFLLSQRRYLVPFHPVYQVNKQAESTCKIVLIACLFQCLNRSRLVVCNIFPNESGCDVSLLRVMGGGHATSTPVYFGVVLRSVRFVLYLRVMQGRMISITVDVEWGDKSKYLHEKKSSLQPFSQAQIAQKCSRSDLTLFRKKKNQRAKLSRYRPQNALWK